MKTAISFLKILHFNSCIAYQIRVLDSRPLLFKKGALFTWLRSLLFAPLVAQGIPHSDFLKKTKPTITFQFIFNKYWTFIKKKKKKVGKSMASFLNNSCVYPKNDSSCGIGKRML